MIGARIQNYQVTSLLGQGGMGAVYVAQHPIIGRKVAIKVLQPEMAKDKSLVDRFINEARAANVLGHPNIVDILDVGTLPDGVPYIIMELLAGESLGQRLDRVGRIDAGQAVKMAVQAISALAAAHAAGIVHRDLKPDNLFVVAPNRATAAGAGEVIKVLDFGIAKMKRDLTNSPLTSTGALMGTPVYMSPEQCRGVPGEVDHRTDIYSMGIILYQMLCGRPPFTSEGLGDILVSHLTRAPQPLRALAPEVPARVERAVLAALEKDKEKRPPTMEAFQELLLAGGENEKSLAPTMLAPPDRSTWPPAASPPLNPPAGTPPATAAAREPTTFRASAGEVYGEDDGGARRKRNVMIGGGAGALGVIALVVMLAARGGGGAQPPAGSAAPAPAVAAVAAAPVAPAPPAAPVVPAPSPAEAPAAAAPAPAPAAVVSGDAQAPASQNKPGRGNRAARPRKVAQRSEAPAPRSASAAGPRPGAAARTSPLAPPPPAPAAADTSPTPPPRKTKKW